jgi:hypothetical protein
LQLAELAFRGDQFGRHLRTVGPATGGNPIAQLGFVSPRIWYVLKLACEGRVARSRVVRAQAEPGSPAAGQLVKLPAMTDQETIESCEVPGFRNCYVIGSFDDRITFYSQQVRALNLIAREEQFLRRAGVGSYERCQASRAASEPTRDRS